MVDDNRVETLNVERALPRRRHRQEIGLLLFGLQKWTNYPDWLATVIEGAVDTREPRPHQLRRLLDTRSRRKEHPDSATLLHDLLQKPIVEKCSGILAHDLPVR